MNTRAKGSYFERTVRKYLEKRGYFVVRQAASSFPDLIAITPSGAVWMIECKVNKYLSKVEKEELMRLKLGYNANVYKSYPKYSTYSKNPKNVILEPL